MNMNNKIIDSLSIFSIALILSPASYTIFTLFLPHVIAEILTTITCIILAMPIHDLFYGDNYLERFIEEVKILFRNRL